MISLILSGHGHIASGLNEAITQVFGAQPELFVVDFPEGIGTEQLERDLRAALARCANPQVLIVTDLLGGSPFRTAARLVQERPGIEVVAGMNLALFADMLFERDDCASAAECRQRAVETGRAGITSLAEQLAKKRQHSEMADGL
ncbi:PTS galactosamine/N-acetylgalactosamine transporter subunit IIA [Paludibacterium purpuratum]|uniref:PTS system N-acetylgalactosamine-specific EIIA component (Man family) n=1 Tax=Paludibacterium purpuratum TaxID=1144873 RepID=A0A4R7B1F5_9NEIS|nr:PTS galactosamine/N-acetylgalactosamine transporter subunit IIA [Paludibacterium purpuratum]TDR73284.1 PTS system N-acetylgalactosamine-specific EIIA component (Man family) [Paludibacterium purpuratum]